MKFQRFIVYLFLGIVFKRVFHISICRHLGLDELPGLLEAHCVRLAVEWLARSPQKHSSRVVLLIDSKAILGAVCKGRTSARSIRTQIRHICAIALAADLSLYCIYIPSEHNPADAPSRGRSIT